MGDGGIDRGAETERGGRWARLEVRDFEIGFG